MKLVYIKPSEPVRLIECDGSYESLRELVGGYIEPIYLPDNAVALVDEEGALKGLPPLLSSSTVMASPTMLLDLFA